MSAADHRPILMCRLECPASTLAALDEWIPKHLDDSLQHPAVTSAANYVMLRDFEHLPSILNNHGNRMVIYAAADIEGCLEWLDSPIIREAIEDGVDRESKYPYLDGEPFIGNIYAVTDVRSSLPDEFSPEGHLLVERFDVPKADLDEFDTWLGQVHLGALASAPGVLRARTWSKVEDAPKRFPYNRYDSKGNRMVMVEVGADTDPYDFVSDPTIAAALQESTSRWDTRLPYVRRDLCSNLVIRLLLE